MPIARLSPIVAGMGDAFWLLPCLKAIGRQYDEVYVETPWPQAYWNLRWVKPINPLGLLGSGSDFMRWPVFQESVVSIPPNHWVTRVPEDAKTIPICQTGDYSTRIKSFCDFDGEVDMRFRCRFSWLEEGLRWLRSVSGLDATKPRVLLHLPMQAIGMRERGDRPASRYCDPALFLDIYNRYRERVAFFDAQRLVDYEPCIEIPEMPSHLSDSGGAPVMWALAQLADVIVTTDNHMLPIALALGRPTLYLAGGVETSYLFDSRMSTDFVEIAERGCAVGDACGAFERILARSSKIDGLMARNPA